MKKNIFVTIGSLFIIIAFLVNCYSIFRLVLLATGIFLIVLQYTINKPKHIIFLVLLPIILIVSTYLVDTALFDYAKRLPIYVYEVKSSDKVSSYNSFFYRIYNCDGVLTKDLGYKESYMCKRDDLLNQDINAFLGETLETYKNYNNKFVKITGKISKLSGLDTIELSSYDKNETSLNGYVTFNTSYIVRAKTNIDLNQFKIYDFVTIIGLVDSLTNNNDNYVINLIDTLVIPSDIYKDYTLEVVNNDSKELKEYVNKDFYLYGIDKIFVHYDKDVVYDLSYLITDTRISLEDILKDKESEELKNEDKVLIAKKYNIDKFNLLVCTNNKTIFSNNKYSLPIELCN
ncbi:MAG: hypothetical protein RSD29_01785 [Bacilli bacterium]